ncbi:MAG: MFS transporter [Treponema sp.]|jgi:predicted MFS family arabinose efflux permease|nr:MFS transporter [Treponema sp.]
MLFITRARLKPVSKTGSKPISIGKNKALFFCSFVYCLATNILSFSLIYLLTDRFSFTSGQVGSSIALGSGCYFMGCFLYQQFGSRGRPRRIIPAAVTGCLVSALVLNFTKNGALAVLSWSTLQMSNGFYWPPLQAWFTQGLNDQELNKDISWFNRCWMSGALLGPFLGGFLYHYNPGWIFIAAFICLGIVLCALISLSVYTGSSGAESAGLSSPANTEASGNPKTPPLLRKTIVLFKIRGWVGAFCVNFFYGILSSVIPLHLRNNLGFSEKTASLLLLFRGAAAIIAFTWFARYTFWHFNRRWFFILQGILILCALFFIIPGTYLLIYLVIAFVYGLFYAGCYNNSIFHSGADKRNTGKNMALHEMFLSIGSATGALGGGFIFQYFGITVALLFLALVQALGLLALVFIDRQA